MRFVFFTYNLLQVHCYRHSFVEGAQSGLKVIYIMHLCVFMPGSVSAACVSRCLLCCTFVCCDEPFSFLMKHGLCAGALVIKNVLCTEVFISMEQPILEK